MTSLLILLMMLLLESTLVPWSEGNKWLNIQAPYVATPRARFAITELNSTLGSDWSPYNYAVVLGVDPTFPSANSHAFEYLSVADRMVTLAVPDSTTYIQDHRLSVTSGTIRYDAPPGLATATGSQMNEFRTNEVMMCGGQNGTGVEGDHLMSALILGSPKTGPSLKRMEMMFDTFEGFTMVRCSVESHDCSNALYRGPNYKDYTFSIGSFLIYGGKLKNGTINSVLLEYAPFVYYKNDTSLPRTAIVSNPSSSGTGLQVIPPARAWHSALFTSDRLMYVFGGIDSNNNYLNDMWIYSYWSSWILVNVTGPVPPPRAGHVMLFGKQQTTTIIDDESVIYLFGGENGITVFNDLWAFDTNAQNWTQIFSSQQPPPPARAYHGGGAIYSSVTSGTILFFYGGIAYNRSIISTFSAIHLNENCEYYCTVGIPSCRSQQLCVASVSCPWDSSTPFQCNYDCKESPTYNCTSTTGCSNSVQCWNGECANSIKGCRPFPYCSIGQKRCNDGSCQPETNPLCVAGGNQCADGLKLCVDGICRQECQLYFGCLPDSNPVQCGDGSCASSLEACNSRCINNTSNSTIACFRGCRQQLSSCQMPSFTSPVIPSPETSVDVPPNRQVEILINCTLGGIYSVFNKGILIAMTPSSLPSDTFSLVSTIDTVDMDEIRSIGPLPTWNTQFNAIFLRSVVANINLTNVGKLYQLGGNVTYLTEYTQVDSEKPNDIVTNVCVARAVPWYWDSMDNTSTSLLAHVPYIAAFRNYTLHNPTVNINSTAALNAVAHPARRWRCLLAPENQWPRWLDVSNQPDKSQYIYWFGVILTEDLDSTPIALITLYSPGTAPLSNHSVPNKQAPQGLAKDRTASYAVMGVAATILFVLIIVVLIKALQKK